MAQKKSKERPEEPLGTMSYQTSSKWSAPFWLLIGFSVVEEEKKLRKIIKLCRKETQSKKK